MARYTGPITKKSRRLKMDLVGGDKNFELRPFPPGQHGRRRIQEKEYLTQLQEKQKARFTYGVMEKQFRRYYKEAANRPGKTGENILTILESRLDNVVYRAGLARTRRQSRQLVKKRTWFFASGPPSCAVQSEKRLMLLPDDTPWSLSSCVRLSETMLLFSK